MDTLSNDRLGHFDDAASEFVITTPDTPRDWYNYLWNAEYVALFSQSGQGESLTQDGVGRRIAAVASRQLFLRDRASGAFRTLNALPVDAPRKMRQAYCCRHGLGYSVIEQAADGISSSLRCFVPPQGACEVWTVTLHNDGAKARAFDLFAFFGTTFDGVFKPQTYYQPTGRFDKPHNAVVLFNPQHRFGAATSAFVFLTASRRISRYDCALSGFVGHGTEQRPDAVVRGACANTGALMEKCCCATELPLTLRPGASATINFLAGAGTDLRELARLRRSLFAAGAVEQACAKVKHTIAALLGDNRIATPDAQLNAFFHPWLKRQASLGVQWARVRHNGFRDQMQDIWAMASMNTREAEHQLARVLAFQHSDGHAPRTWLDGQILDKDFSDNHVWIAPAVHQLAMETGDLALLEQTIPFNDGSQASLYEHVKRAVGYSWSDRGLHGLLKIRSGDWNDCLNGLGPKGRGVSVWLSMAWLAANRQFAELAQRSGHARDAATARARGAEMKRLINRHAWDGAWYLRAFHDDGRPLGSRQNRQGTMFLLPQAWAVISGAADDAQARLAMQSVDRLLECELGTRKVLNPFDHWDPSIGYSSIKLPGVHENGGVYLHANCFKLMADCMLKRPEHVAEALHKMLPFDHTFRTKTCEPYVFCNSYFATPGNYRYGSAGQSWGTGTAAWFYAVLLHHVFGLQATFDGLRVDPCLPPEWKQCVVRRSFRGAMYDVTFDQSAGRRTIGRIVVNGKTLDTTLLPWRRGSTYTVTVEMK